MCLGQVSVDYLTWTMAMHTKRDVTETAATDLAANTVLIADAKVLSKGLKCVSERRERERQVGGGNTIVVML